MYIQTSLDSEPRVFFDPNTLSEDGTVSLSHSAFSESGRYFAYGLSKQGSDWTTIHIKTVDEKDPRASEFTEKIEWVKFSGITWLHNDEGFFYSRFPTEYSSNEGTETGTLKKHEIRFHKIGTPQSEDVLIYNEPENEGFNFGSQVTDDGKYLLIITYKDCDPVHKLYYYEIPSSQWIPKPGDPLLPVVKFINEFTAKYSYITNEKTVFWFKTNKDAPRYKVVKVDISSESSPSWTEIIPQSKDVLSYAICVNQSSLVVTYMRDVADVMELYKLDGTKVKEFELPTFGTIVDISGRKQHDEMFYKFSSFLSPGTTYRYVFGGGKDNEDLLSVFREVEIPGFDPTLFTAERVFYTSYDGTVKIPIFLVYKKTLKKDGNNPVFLYGYGGFNISIQPYFSSIRLVWMQNFNGIYALASIRGGGEYGEEWHKSGVKDKKQNSFSDFQAAAEFLIKEGYTNSGKITINGASNGGLLVMACVTQRPDLFRCAVADVGVLDMLKFHKFTIGRFWVSDYGCADNPDEFDYVYKYSPVHNVKKGKPYPSLLLSTADHDDRVSPLHSFKMIAELQTQLGSEPYQKNPLLIRIERKAGHGAGKPVSKIIEEQSDIFGFVSNELGLEWTD
eukprot:TRINITY_DN3667_c0_g1_i3.p1 TRINITY_DN3667_c0_g1~~TRINITY_DN3667_c0_g1_i3.p1  ORF type:complete len:618 (+),score=149.49 TRINITY_DN3667_c0_g1_i3:426-2279(+)